MDKNRFIKSAQVCSGIRLLTIGGLLLEDPGDRDIKTKKIDDHRPPGQYAKGEGSFRNRPALRWLMHLVFPLDTSYGAHGPTAKAIIKQG